VRQYNLQILVMCSSVIDVVIRTRKLESVKWLVGGGRCLQWHHRPTVWIKPNTKSTWPLKNGEIMLNWALYPSAHSSNRSVTYKQIYIHLNELTDKYLVSDLASPGVNQHPACKLCTQIKSVTQFLAPQNLFLIGPLVSVIIHPRKTM